MISFAQNFEDVILARIFRDRLNGFYVDIGAHYPLIDSVTEHFYRNGWRGINIEPLPSAFNELVRVRPLDINLNAAISEVEGEIPFFALDGFSTLNADVAGRHHKSGLDSQTILVQGRRLDTILAQHSPKHIDFLKIDVEGAEEGVVRSNDWDRFRPSIILIEMIDPQTQEIRFESWESIIVDAGYDVVHFDGVNRWYWNRDFPSASSNCFLPPNALDHFTSFEQISAEAHAAAAAREAAYEREKSAKLLAKIGHALNELAQGGYSTPTPDDSLAGAWLNLQELVRRRNDVRPTSTAEMSDANHEIEGLKLQIENLLTSSEALQRRLVFSEQSRATLAEALSSRGIVV